MFKTEVMNEVKEFGASVWEVVKAVGSLAGTLLALYAAFGEGDYAKASFFAIVSVSLQR